VRPEALEATPDDGGMGVPHVDRAPFDDGAARNGPAVDRMRLAEWNGPIVGDDTKSVGVHEQDLRILGVAQPGGCPGNGCEGFLEAA
jgi:hypothetical protein